MEDLDLLGAEGLSGQYIVLRVRAIDKQKLGQSLGGVKGAMVPAALAVVDFAPQQALGLLMPLVQEKVKGNYGVDLDYQITDAPPAPGEKGKGGGTVGKLLLGAALGIAGAWAGSRFGLVGAGQNLLHKVGL